MVTEASPSFTPVDIDELRTLPIIEALAKEKIPPDLWAYGSGGSSSEATLDRNRRALERLAIEQRVLRDVRNVDTTARFLDMTLPSPIITAPMGRMYSYHPDGDVEMARGATSDGGMAVVSGVAGWPLEEIGAAAGPGPLMFQLYWLGDRDWVAEKLSHVVPAGFKAFCLTVDMASYSRRERDIAVGMVARIRGGPAPAPAPSGREFQAALNWEDVAWIRKQIDVPFGLKGILSAADARIAVEEGVDFIWASNHGGRQLDDGRATIDVLPEIADAVQGRAPIIVDGGFRRGTDALKGLALGATLVAYGRTVLWGFAVSGADGARRSLRLLNEELRINLALSGQTVASQLPPEMIRTVDY
jgi:isopentenyl diphosphate isomerase/L-lactate dehydrogenase-like FMN-dependent dehydrogenase